MMATAGWIKLHRKIKNNPIIRDPILLQVFIWCLVEAESHDVETLGRGTVRAGSFETTRDAAAESLNMRPTTWYATARRLEKFGYISLSSDNRKTTVSICNWQTYQRREKGSMTTGRQQDDNGMTTGRQQSDSPLIGIEEDEEVKNAEPRAAVSAARTDLESPPPKPPRASTGFEEFWTAYPRKVAKVAAVKAWTKLAPTPEMLTAILAAVARDRKTEQWTRENGQFIPHPASYLNGRRWEDELIVPTVAGPTRDELVERTRRQRDEAARLQSQSVDPEMVGSIFDRVLPKLFRDPQQDAPHS